MARPRCQINEISAKRIRMLMKDYGLNGKQFAQKAGLSEQTVSKIINGRSPLTIQTAKIIANVFYVNYEWLLGSREDRSIDETKYNMIRNRIESDKSTIELIRTLGYEVLAKGNGYYDVEYTPYRGNTLIYYESFHRSTGETIHIIDPQKRMKEIPFVDFMKIVLEINRFSRFVLEGLFEDQEEL